MGTRTRQLLDEALELPPTERAELIEGLYRSFDFPARADVDAAWAAEAEERIDAHNRGELKSVPAAKVFKRINGLKHHERIVPRNRRGRTL